MSSNGIGTWDLANSARDLTDVLSTLVAQQPVFMGAFPRRRSATNVKHEWLEDVLKPRSVAFTGYDGTTGTFTVANGGSDGWNVGDVVRIKGDSALFSVVSKTAATIVVAFLASNGSGIESLTGVTAASGTLIFDHAPVLQGSSNGESLFSQSGTDFNYTEIIRCDVELSNTALATRTYGNENSMQYQMERAMIHILRQMNNVCLFGNRVASAPSSLLASRAGGLYYFGNQSGGLTVNAGSAAASLKLINDAAQEVLNAGANPDLVLCGPGQARVISQLLRNQIQLAPGDVQRGTYVNKIVSESTGQVMRVLVDPNLSSLDTDIWVIDSTGFGLAYLGGRELHSEPATAPGYDGQKWSIIGEFTFEFKNAKQKICRIKGLKESSLSLV